MTTSTAGPYHWLKFVPPSSLKRDIVPLMGMAPPFPWEQLSQKLKDLFELKDLTIKPNSSFEWREKNDLYSGLGQPHTSMIFSLLPAKGNLYWVMAEQDVALLMSLLLTQKPQPMAPVDTDFLQGFYRFLAMEVANVIPTLDFDKAITPRIETSGPELTERVLCLDLAITLSERTIWGRAIISPPLRQSWLERYAERSMSIPLAAELDVTVHLEVGRTSLKFSQWTKMSPGDFILLDSCSLKTTGEGRVMLTIDNFPCFRGKIKDGNIKILEHPLYHEADMTLENPPPDEGDAEEDYSYLEDEDVDEGEELYDLEEEEGLPSEQFTEDFGAETPPEESSELPPSSQESQETLQPDQTPDETPQPPPEKKVFSPKDIPLSIVVEVGRLQMSIRKVMELQPGNMLELNIHPENGVDLVVNGKRIAKGELLLIGETLGVRVLEIG